MTNKPRLITLPRFLDHRGNLSVIEELTDIPFPIRRTYWVYDVPGGEEREGHAYRRNEEFVIALSGSFDVITDNGEETEEFRLCRSYHGVYIPPGVWRTFTNFSTNAVALVIASTPHDPEDYIYSRKNLRNDTGNNPDDRL